MFLSGVAARIWWTKTKGFLSSVPAGVWYALLVLLLGLIVWKAIDSYGDGRYEQGRVDLLAEQAKAQVKLEVAQEKVTERVVTEYVDRIVEVEKAGRTIIKRVPVYVTVVDDSRCTINAGFVRLWNDSNQGKVSESSAGADAAPSGVVLSEVATQKATEALICRKTEQQLISLQQWVLRQQELWEEHQQ